MQILDLEVVSQLREMLGDDIDELFDDLLQLVPEELSAMALCAQRGDLECVEHKAHQIKGSSANLGVLSFAEACRKLEEGLRRGEIQDPTLQLNTLTEQFALATQAIRALSGP